MRDLTVLDVAIALLTVVFVVTLSSWIREHLGVHRPPRNPPRSRPPAPKEKVDELGELIICGSWPINPGDRVRILVAVPEYGTEIGHVATCEAVWPGDDVQYRFTLDGRRGRDAIITFLETELWQLERLPA